MRIHHLLKEMEAQAFGEAFFQEIRQHYEKEVLEEAWEGVKETYDYNHAALLEHLSPDLTELFTEAVALYEKRCSFAASFSFKRGLFGGFRQYFGRSMEKDAGYNELVLTDLMMQPRMQLYHENYKNLSRCNEIQATIQATFPETQYDETTGEAIEHNCCTKIFCMLEECVDAAAVHGFYCGYRAAHEIIGHAEPLEKMTHIDQLLCTEYHLGYLEPHREM